MAILADLGSRLQYGCPKGTGAVRSLVWSARMFSTTPIKSNLWTHADVMNHELCTSLHIELWTLHIFETLKFDLWGCGAPWMYQPLCAETVPPVLARLSMVLAIAVWQWWWHWWWWWCGKWWRPWLWWLWWCWCSSRSYPWAVALLFRMASYQEQMLHRLMALDVDWRQTEDWRASYLPLAENHVFPVFPYPSWRLQFVWCLVMSCLNLSNLSCLMSFMKFRLDWLTDCWIVIQIELLS